MMQDVMGGVEKRELRQVFGTFATGVTVVTTRTDDGVPHGTMVNAFAAVSVDPPLVQITMTRASRAAGYLEGAPFAINILSLEQVDAARHFAGKVVDPEPEWTLDGNVPVLTGNAGRGTSTTAATTSSLSARSWPWTSHSVNRSCSSAVSSARWDAASREIGAITPALTPNRAGSP